jgi:hypothetical protein
MDADTARYSIDVSSSLSGVSKSEEEGDRLLPSSSGVADEQSLGKQNGSRARDRWRRILNFLLAVLALLLGVLAAVGWIMYWRASSGLHLVGEINGLVPECK